MPRTARAAVGGLVYHLLNRGNNRERIFLKEADYAAFIQLLIDGRKHARIEIFGYCLMPNHWHLLARPRGRRDLAAYLGWVCNAHVKRYRQHYQTLGQGHVYQGRYKSFPVQSDAHFRNVLRYIEANPLRANLVSRAEHWRWSSLGSSPTVDTKPLLDPWPVSRPADWLDWVNQPQSETELASLRGSVNRGRPYGSGSWVVSTARTLGLEQTLRPRGRPRKNTKSDVALAEVRP